MGQQPRIAYFVTPHGFGHAARAAAVMAALANLNPAARFEIFSLVPQWFFDQSSPGLATYHALLTDVGMAQVSALEEDVTETRRRLDAFLPFDRREVRRLARQLSETGCRLVVSDISPLGIAVARQAGLPSVLVENFTWDWIYRAYVAQDSRLGRHIDYLQDIFAQADFLVQTRPVCVPRPAAQTTSPVARRARESAADVRRQLGIPLSAKMVLVTMGGMAWQYTFLERLATRPDVYFVFAGAEGDAVEGRRPGGNSIFLAANSGFFHPNLLNASDVVVGKAGYSTVAEVYWAGVAYGYVSRPQFPEARVLGRFLNTAVPSLPLSQGAFEDGSWLEQLDGLLAMPRITRSGPDGASQVARFLDQLLD